MGLYDDISLPIELLKENSDEHIKKYASLFSTDTAAFQTKDLACAMLEYDFQKLDNEYVLHRDVVERELVENKASKDIFKFHFNEKTRTSVREHTTATILVYAYYTSTTVDISIDLELRLVDGVLFSVACTSYKENDPAIRIKMYAEAMQKLKDSIAYHKTFRGKSALVVRRLLLRLHKNLCKFNSWLLRCIHKL